MTSLAAWVGVDSRGISSLYFASDSRITWDRSRTAWNFGGVAHEKAGEDEDAIRSFTLYLLAAPSADDALAVKKRIGGLQYAAQKAQNEANSPEAQWKKILQSLDGGIWVGPTITSPPGVTPPNCIIFLYEIHDGMLVLKRLDWDAGQPEPDPSQARIALVRTGVYFKPVAVTGRRFTYRADEQEEGDCYLTTLEISDSGNTITESSTCYGRIWTKNYARYK